MTKRAIWRLKLATGAVFLTSWACAFESSNLRTTAADGIQFHYSAHQLAFAQSQMKYGDGWGIAALVLQLVVLTALAYIRKRDDEKWTLRWAKSAGVLLAGDVVFLMLAVIFFAGFGLFVLAAIAYGVFYVAKSAFKMIMATQPPAEN